MPLLVVIILFVVGVPLIVMMAGGMFVSARVDEFRDIAQMVNDPDAAYEQYLAEQAAIEASKVDWTVWHTLGVVGVGIMIVVIAVIGWRLSKNQEGYAA